MADKMIIHLVNLLQNEPERIAEILIALFVLIALNTTLVVLTVSLLAALKRRLEDADGYRGAMMLDKTRVLLQIGAMAPLTLFWHVVWKVFFGDATMALVIIQVSLFAIQITCFCLFLRRLKRL